VDFENALNYEHEITLLNETHMSLLKVLGEKVNEDNWQDKLRAMLEKDEEFEEGTSLAEKMEDDGYYSLDMKDRLTVLNYLCDQALDSEVCRTKIEESMEMISTLEKEKREVDLEEKRKAKEKGKEEDLQRKARRVSVHHSVNIYHFRRELTTKNLLWLGTRYVTLLWDKIDIGHGIGLYLKKMRESS
jgi:hypothetical protein